MLLILVACGKETKDSKSPGAFQEEIRPGELEAQLARQSVTCENGVSCPPGIAKISIVDRGRLKTCTGFLVNATTVATAASCLTDRLRVTVSDRLCQSDVHVFFAASDFQGEKRVGCASFLLVTPTNGNDPVLWNRDLAYITLAEPMPRRRRLDISRDGVEDGQDLRMWKVDQENDQVGVIRRSNCAAVLNSYANPLSKKKFDPNFLMSDCALRTGNRGAPVLNSKGDWVGIYSAPLSSEMMSWINGMTDANGQRLLTEGLKSLGHVSSAVCLPALRDDNPVTRAECFRELTVPVLDAARDALINGPSAHTSALAGFAELVSDLRPYLNWDAELVREGNAPGNFRVKMKPKCFKPVANWIRNFQNPNGRLTYRMNVPDWRVRIGLDRAARISSRVTNGATKTLNVEFSLSQVRSGRSSYVRAWTNLDDNSYDTITESCE